MIKTNELRIGNYLMFGYPCVVTEIDSEGCMLVDINLDYSSQVYILFEKASPIPLTEEWLIKFGAKVWKNNDYIPYDLGKEQICIYEGQLYFYGNSGAIGQPLQYVHQLQNLYFALTGEELMIKE